MVRENSGETRMGRRRARLKRGCGGSFRGGVAACGGEEVGGECSRLRDGRWKGRGRSLEWNGREEKREV